MSASLTNIQPVPDGRCLIYSRQQFNNKIVFLNALSPGTEDGVGLSSTRATDWSLQYIPSHGSYRIWQSGTNHVLDASRTRHGSITTWDWHDNDLESGWQQWAIRLHSVRSHSGAYTVIGYSFTPLSDPKLAMSVPPPPTGKIGLDTQWPAKILQTPGLGNPLDPDQLWIIDTTPVTQREDRANATEGEEEESLEFEDDKDAYYSEEILAQVDQAKKQLAESLAEAQTDDR